MALNPFWEIVSIPKWFDLKTGKEVPTYLINPVSIPKWFDLKGRIYDVLKDLIARFNSKVVRFKGLSLEGLSKACTSFNSKVVRFKEG